MGRKNTLPPPKKEKAHKQVYQLFLYYTGSLHFFPLGAFKRIIGREQFTLHLLVDSFWGLELPRPLLLNAFPFLSLSFPYSLQKTLPSCH